MDDITKRIKAVALRLWYLFNFFCFLLSFCIFFFNVTGIELNLRIFYISMLPVLLKSLAMLPFVLNLREYDFLELPAWFKSNEMLIFIPYLSDIFYSIYFSWWNDWDENWTSSKNYNEKKCCQVKYFYPSVAY